jgi:metacaspase-1
MVKGKALTIGLNAVDPKHYTGWSGELAACENDARDLAEITGSRKFEVATLLTAEATRAKVIAGITQAAKDLEAKDIFVLSYSGHGGQVPDENNDEDDGEDETWCLYDGELIDDEIYLMLSKFKPGVRIVVLSDSCHSGTVVRNAYYAGIKAAIAARPEMGEHRYMPVAVAQRTYRNNRAFYDKLLTKPELVGAKEAVKASVILISGCQDNQTSADGTFNGLFTSMLLRAWRHGQFKGTYRSFYKAIARSMPPDQSPNYYKLGDGCQEFEEQQPFEI